MLVDAGPLIAMIDRSDPAHERCRSSIANTRPPLVTTWAVLAEASHLLGRHVNLSAQTALLDLVDRGMLTIAPLTSDHVAEIAERMTRYADHPMDLADATLVEAAELTGDHEILTLDAHFLAYRLSRNRRFTVLPA